MHHNATMQRTYSTRWLRVAICCIAICCFCIFACEPDVERYINNNCNFEKADTCDVDMRKVFKDYDTMYVFYFLTPLSGVRNILGIDDYKKDESPETFIGDDSNVRKIILVKNNKVVSEYDTQHYFFERCPVVKGQGVFDGDILEVQSYVCTDYIFKFSRHALK